MLKFGSPTLIRNIFVHFVKPPVLGVPKKSSINLLAQSVRYTSFFNRLTGEQLWKGVSSVSNAGKRKGRGKGASKNVRNLNFGQRIGLGKIRVHWPGLNTPVIKNKEVQKVKEVKDAGTDAPVAPPPIKKKFSFKVHPLERGWSGRQQRGRKIGPPEPIEDETFEDFESIILENKMRSQMTSVLGRRRTFFSIVAVGNGNGIIGVGRAKSIDSKSSIALAKSRASKRLLTVDLIEGHTVNHNFFCEYGRTKIFVFKAPEGHGLRCQRVITALCQLIGIKNLRAKIEGATNPIHIIRAFITGLLQQKTYQQIADENKLHLVEFRSDTSGFPRVLASPEKCLTRKESLANPVLFEEYIMGGKLLYQPDKKVPFFQKLPSWTNHLKKTLYHRNHEQVKIELTAEYGSLKSHLTRVYPECTKLPPTKTESAET